MTLHVALDKSRRRVWRPRDAEAGLAADLREQSVRVGLFAKHGFERFSNTGSEEIWRCSESSFSDDLAA